MEIRLSKGSSKFENRHCTPVCNLLKIAVYNTALISNLNTAVKLLDIVDFNILFMCMAFFDLV